MKQNALESHVQQSTIFLLSPNQPTINPTPNLYDCFEWLANALRANVNGRG